MERGSGMALDATYAYGKPPRGEGLHDPSPGRQHESAHVFGRRAFKSH